MENIKITLEVNKQYFVEVLGYRTHLDLYTVENYLRKSTQNPYIKSDSFLIMPHFKRAIQTANYSYSQDDYTGMLVGIKILRSYTILHYNSDSTTTPQKFFDIRLTNPTFSKEYQEKRIITHITVEDLNVICSSPLCEVKFTIKE